MWTKWRYVNEIKLMSTNFSFCDRNMATVTKESFRSHKLIAKSRTLSGQFGQLLWDTFFIWPALMGSWEARYVPVTKINHTSWATTFTSHLNTLVSFKSQKMTEMLSLGNFSETVFWHLTSPNGELRGKVCSLAQKLIILVELPPLLVIQTH